MERNYQRLKKLKDFLTIDAPKQMIAVEPHYCPYEEQKILRMLVKPKYGDFRIPQELEWLWGTIDMFAGIDYIYTGIKESWCYVTVRHGPVTTKTDDEWHFDGASFRTSIIPERNYVWVNHTPPQYKTGSVDFPDDFDPCKHDLFSFATHALVDEPIQTCEAKEWYLMNPFCFHRRNPITPPGSRTFIRISFPDIEGRDVMNTPNPLLDTPAWGRNPVQSFRNNLENYHD